MGGTRVVNTNTSWGFSCLTLRSLYAVTPPKGIQGSLISLGNGSQIFAKPLSDGAFAVALLNTAASVANVSVSWGMLAPQHVGGMAVRDLWGRRELGVHAGGYTATVAGHGVAVLKATPEQRRSTEL